MNQTVVARHDATRLLGKLGLGFVDKLSPFKVRNVLDANATNNAHVMKLDELVSIVPNEHDLKMWTAARELQHEYFVVLYETSYGDDSGTMPRIFLVS